LGADVVNLLASRHNAPMRRGKERALVAEARVAGKLMALAFPQTFVNLSGESAARLVRRYGVEGDMGKVVVVHDELDLPAGRVKIKEGGGTAGHNGLESIRAHLHSGAFIRVRIGIGKPPGRQQGADYVLKPIRKAEQVEFDVAVVEAAEAVELIFTEGVATAMNRVNTVA
jgi:PTH1 family peptidyl-tRNA hydrolase